jgi:nucleoside-diphosphate-sugar epimerase
MSKTNTVLVTGGTGLVGSHLLVKLVAAGHSVRAIQRSSSDLTLVERLFTHYHPQQPELFTKIQWTEGDVTDYYSLLDAMEGVSKVYHSAAFVSFNPGDKKQMFRVNEEGTANVVNACLKTGIEKLCYVSSIATLGSANNGHSIDEDSIWQADEHHSNYSLSKFRAEMEVWRGTKEGLNAVVVNPGIIIGPGDMTRSSGALFKSVSNGMPFYTLGTSGFVDVRDVVNAMILLTESDANDERFVLTAENLSYQTIFTLVSDALNVKRPSREAKPWMTSLAWRLDALKSFLTRADRKFTRENAKTAHNVSHYSSERFCTRFNYKFIPIDKAIADTAKWYS